jgi:hypothetical protein
MVLMINQQRLERQVALLALTLSSFPIFWRHFAKEAWTSRVMVDTEGMTVWSHPAVKMF